MYRGHFRLSKLSTANQLVATQAKKNGYTTNRQFFSALQNVFTFVYPSLSRVDGKDNVLQAETEDAMYLWLDALQVRKCYKNDTP